MTKKKVCTYSVMDAIFFWMCLIGGWLTPEMELTPTESPLWNRESPWGNYKIGVSITTENWDSVIMKTGQPCWLGEKTRSKQLPGWCIFFLWAWWKEHGLSRRDRLGSDSGFPRAWEPQAQFTHREPLSCTLSGKNRNLAAVPTPKSLAQRLAQRACCRDESHLTWTLHPRGRSPASRCHILLGYFRTHSSTLPAVQYALFQIIII